MSLSNLYFRCCFEPLSEQQRASIIEACGTADVVDKSCSRESVNTCGMSLSDLLLSEGRRFSIDSFSDIDVFYDSFVLDNLDLLGRNVAFIYSGPNSAIQGISSGSRFFLKRRADVVSSILSIDKTQDSILVENIGLADGNTVFYTSVNNNSIGLIEGKKYYVKVIEYLEYSNSTPTRARIQLFSSKDLSSSSRVNIDMKETSLVGTHRIAKKNLFQLFTSRNFSPGSLVNITGQPTGTHVLEVAPVLFYDPQKGLYKSWGDIEFPWQINNLTPNLLFSETDDRWAIAAYSSLVAYKEGTRVLLVEEDGYRISLYEANQDVASISRAFDPSKWTKICHVETTKPAGIPSIAELRARYKPYSLELFDKRWEEYNDDWSANLSEQSLTHCTSLNLTISELEKCLKNSSSDDWSQARIRREFFYRAGDLVLVEGECGDTLCVYISLVDIPATDFIYEEYADGPFLESIYLTPQDKTNDNKTIVWQRIYCVSTDENRCLGYQRKKEPRLGYQVVEIGSKGHYVEAPVERWDRKPKDLGEASELRPPAATLGPLEILALEGEKSPFREECEE